MGLLLYRVRLLISILILLMSLAGPLMVVYEYGFPIDDSVEMVLSIWYRRLLSGLWFAITLRFLLGLVIMGYRSSWKQTGKGDSDSERYSLAKWVGYSLFTVVVALGVSVHYNFIQIDGFLEVATGDAMVKLVLVGVSILEISQAVTGMLSQRANPSLILASSFLVIILLGSLLLMLPKCTYGGIDYIDSLFISASAVCVTGLTPLDVSATFTTSGLIVLLFLIQVGGLGIMTITSFFGLFFMGGGSLANQIMVSDLLSGERISGLIRTLLKIIVVTITVEAVGALVIYSIMMNETVMNSSESMFYAVFHAISAFCNAGFSTLSGNLYDPVVRDLNSLHYTISTLVIFGGIGFPIFANTLHFLGHNIHNFVRRLSGLRSLVEPRLWSLNTYIVIKTTLILIVISTVSLTVIEWNHALAEFDFWNKLSQGFLMAITPRTAGFSGVDMAKMTPAAVAITMVLMWIGGAPQSTAGGIKVTTIYIAMRNIFASTTVNALDGQPESIEVQRRRISTLSVRRAFGVVTLSLSIVMAAAITLSLLHPKIEFSKLLFECFSALGTVGLSIGVTEQLGTMAKVVVITLMFVGRVGFMGMLWLFLRTATHRAYTYPREDVMIS